MGTVGTSLTMSLDGFIAGPNAGPDNPLGDGGTRLFAWYGGGDTDYRMPSGAMTVKVAAASAEMLREAHAATGALVTGRTTFNITDGWGGRHPMDVPVFVVTNVVPEAWVRAHPGAPFVFITDGVASAVRQAQLTAGDLKVGVGAASVVQQCLRDGMLDEVQVEVVPVLLGGGVRLFDHRGEAPVDLEPTTVIEGAGVTHLRYRVVKRA